MGDIESYQGEKVVFTRKRLDREFTDVQSLLINARDATYTMNYRLQEVDKEWRGYDVRIDSVSILNNYRSQVNWINKRWFYEELVRRIKDRTVSRQN